MGLRCSLLGHDYGEPDVEREREERGNEVVITIRELETCTRCGAESVVSENTEVRPIGPPPSTTEPDEEPDASPADAGDVAAGPPDDSVEDAGGAASADVGAPAADLDAPPADADDGVILDDEEDEQVEGERAPGEWPSAADTRLEEGEVPTGAEGDADATAAATDESTWPDEGEQPDGDAAVDADGTFAGDEAANGATRTGEGAANEEAGDGAEIVEFGPGDATGIARAESADVGGETSASAELVCPVCDFEETSIGASHRAGDICPECRKGYLSER